MTRAVKEYAPRTNPFMLTRRPGARGTYSASGVWGDPTRATAEKGRAVVEALTSDIVKEIEALRKAALPTAAGTSDQPAVADRRVTAPQAPAAPQCTTGDLRTIRSIGDAFAAHWANADAERLGGLWTPNGDIVHPDASDQANAGGHRSESGRAVQAARLSAHASSDAGRQHTMHRRGNGDCRWKMGTERDDGREQKILPSLRGLFTMVVERAGTEWKIVAYRYTIDPVGPTVPTLLKAARIPRAGSTDPMGQPGHLSHVCYHPRTPVPSAWRRGRR